MANRYVINSDSENDIENILGLTPFTKSSTTSTSSALENQQIKEKTKTSPLKSILAIDALFCCENSNPGPSGYNLRKKKRELSPASGSTSGSTTSYKLRKRNKNILDEIAELDKETDKTAVSNEAKQAETSKELRFKQRQQQIVEYQSKMLLHHSEISNSQSIITENDDLSTTKLFMVNKFLDSMTPERIDYKKNETETDNSQYVNCCEDFSEFKNALEERKKTIVKRLDFKKDKRKSLRKNKFLNNLAFTSTPVVNNVPEKADVHFYPSESSLIPVVNNMPKTVVVQSQSSTSSITSTAVTVPETPIVSVHDTQTRDVDLDFSTLDTRFVTMRTPSRTANKINENLSVDVETTPIVTINCATGSKNEEPEIILIDSEESSTEIRSLTQDNEVFEIVDLENFYLNKKRTKRNISNAVNNEDDSVIFVSERKARNVRGKNRKQKTIEKPQVVDKENEITTTTESSTHPINTGNCPICLEPFNNEISSTTCGHIFCTSCIKKSIRLQRKCPKCRVRLYLKNIHPLYF